MSRPRRLRWSIVGIGTAGRARARAIERDERAVLVSVWRGRYASEVEAPLAGSFEEAVQKADCVAICSPSEAHPAQSRAVLEAGRHALVEYPVAHAPDEAVGVFELARRVQRVLHVEHIELLGAAAQTLRALVRPSVVSEVHVEFSRPGPSDASLETLARSNVARLHRLVDVAGPVRSVDDVARTDTCLQGSLTMASGATVTLAFRQAPDERRRTYLRVHTPDAVWEQTNDSLTRNGIHQTLLGVGSLFKLDQLAATARVLDGRAPYVQEDRIVHVLDAIERLAQGCPGPVRPGG